MMKIFKTLLFISLVALLCPMEGRGQKVAVKTNALYWATTTPNLGLEFATGKRTSLDIVGGYNPFTFSNNKKFKHGLIQPEFRIWNCETFLGGFWGIHALYSKFNVGHWDLPLDIFPGLKNHRYEGWAVGGGVSYGHQWYLGPHWNIEATFGFGYAYMEYDRYRCDDCGPFLGKGYKHYIGPTRIGVSFIYLFKSKK